MGNSNPCVWCFYRERDTKVAHTEERLQEDIARRCLSKNQEEKSHQKLNLLSPWSWISSLWNCKKINFHCLTFPVYGSLRRSMHQVSNMLKPDRCGRRKDILPPGSQLLLHGIRQKYMNHSNGVQQSFWTVVLDYI